MAVYNCKAVTKSGKVVHCTMSDSYEKSVMKRLRENGLTPITVKESKAANLFKRGKQEKKNAVNTADVAKINEKYMLDRQRKKRGSSIKANDAIDLSFFTSKPKIQDVMSFTQSFQLLKRAGFTNVRALTSLLETTQNPALRDIIADILNGIEAGEYIYTTLEHYPQVFSPLYINIVKVGELSDSLAESLVQALQSIEDGRDIKRKIKKAVTQPLVMIIALILMSIFAVVFGLPVMESLYTEMGVADKIPAATVAFGKFIRMLGKVWYLWLAGIGVGIYSIIAWLRTPGGRFRFDKFKYKMPLFGQLIIRLDLQKFLRAMQLNLENNAKLSDSIDISKSVVKNYMFLAIVESAQNNLSQGLSWVAPFEECDFMPSMVIEMLKIGMETDIKTMMSKVTEYISSDIEITMARLTAAVPQVALGISGVVLIFFMLVVLRPIMEVYMGGFIADAYL